MMATAMFSSASTFMKWSKMDILAFAVVSVVFAPVIWWIADRTPPVKLIEYSAFPPKVVPGETVFRVIKLERLRKCEAEPQTVMIDGGKIRWVFEERAVSIPGPLGIDEYKRPVAIPLQASPGMAEMRTVTEFVCNPVHRIWPIKLENPVLRFEILKP